MCLPIINGRVMGCTNSHSQAISSATASLNNCNAGCMSLFVICEILAAGNPAGIAACMAVLIHCQTGCTNDYSDDLDAAYMQYQNCEAICGPYGD